MSTRGLPSRRKFCFLVPQTTSRPKRDQPPAAMWNTSLLQLPTQGQGGETALRTQQQESGCTGYNLTHHFQAVWPP